MKDDTSGKAFRFRKLVDALYVLMAFHEYSDDVLGKAKDEATRLLDRLHSAKRPDTSKRRGAKSNEQAK